MLTAAAQQDVLTSTVFAPITIPRSLRLVQPIDFPHKLGILERIYGRALQAHGICWVKTAAGVVWKLDLRNVTHRWIVYGKYEGAPFLNWAKRFLKEDSVVVDSGANIGQLILYYASWVPRGRILAFEPGAAAANWLEGCLRHYPHFPVELIRKGLGSKTSEARLTSEGDATHQGSWNKVKHGGTEGEAVQVVRLADVLASRGLDHVDLWKLDVEGYEIEALEGARSLLERRKVRALTVELAGAHGERTRAMLEGCGYECFLFTANGALVRATTLPGHTNGLFLPKE